MKVNNLIQKIQTTSSPDIDRYEGRAIYPTFAFMSHSCNPNARTVIQVGGHFHQRISFVFSWKILFRIFIKLSIFFVFLQTTLSEIRKRNNCFHHRQEDGTMEVYAQREIKKGDEVVFQ